MSEKVETPKTDDLRNKEIFRYGLTNTGQTMVYAIVGAFIMQFFNETLLVPTFITGIIFGIAGVYDGITDPIMGLVVDRTKTRWGKCRPYMLLTPIPVVLTILILFLPAFSPAEGQREAATGTIIIVTILYFIQTTVYTLNDIPYWSMSAVITRDPEKRVKVVSTTRIIGGMGSATTTVLLMVLVSQFRNLTGSTPWGYFLGVMVLCIVGATLMLQGFFGTKERAIENKSAVKQKWYEPFKLLPKCPPLIINVIGGIFAAITVIGTMAMATYYARWNIWSMRHDDFFVRFIFNLLNINDPIAAQGIFTIVLGVLPAIATIVGLFLTPKFCKKFDKRNVLIIAGLSGFVVNLIFFLIGYQQSALLFMIGRFLACIQAGFWSGITTSMFGDSVDYLEHKTGKRNEGICFSLLTFVGKFGGAISAFLIGIILSIFRFDGTAQPRFDELQQQLGNLQSGSAEYGQILNELGAISQPDVALRGIFFMTTLVMGIGQLLSTIPFFFYKFNKAEHNKVLAELREKRKEQEAN
jgi:Na+/melibiose symporter-like transporter